MSLRKTWRFLAGAVVLGVAGCSDTGGGRGDGGGSGMLADVTGPCQAWCPVVAKQCAPGPADCEADCRCRGMRYSECQNAFAAYMQCASTAILLCPTGVPGVFCRDEKMAYENCVGTRDATCPPCGHEGEICCPAMPTPTCLEGLCTNGSCVVTLRAPYERCDPKAGDKCTGDTTCMSDPGGGMLCTKDCSLNNDCPAHPRRFCGHYGDGGVSTICFHRCDSDAECEMGTMCRDSGQRLCRPTP